MEQTGKHVNPRGTGDVYGVKGARLRSFALPLVFTVVRDLNNTFTWFRSIIIKLELDYSSIRFVKICPRIITIITISDVYRPSTTNIPKRYDYRSCDDQLSIFFNTIYFFVLIKRGPQIHSGDFVGFHSIFERLSQVRHYSVGANAMRTEQSNQFPISTIMARILWAQV
jgi:hypothetical protein